MKKRISQKLANKDPAEVRSALFCLFLRRATRTRPKRRLMCENVPRSCRRVRVREKQENPGSNMEEALAPTLLRPLRASRRPRLLAELRAHFPPASS